MKQLIVIGSTGNNVCMIQIPTSWSLNEAKDMLEKALLQFEDNKSRKEFLTLNDEQELKQMYPKHESDVIKLSSELITAIGSPINGSSGLAWQMHVTEYMLKHKDFAKKIFKAYDKELTNEEMAWLSSNYVDILPTLIAYIKAFN